MASARPPASVEGRVATTAEACPDEGGGDYLPLSLLWGRNAFAPNLDGRWSRSCPVVSAGGPLAFSWCRFVRLAAPSVRGHEDADLTCGVCACCCVVVCAGCSDPFDGLGDSAGRDGDRFVRVWREGQRLELYALGSSVLPTRPPGF